MTKETRPLSPHLSVYRWQVTNTLSIIHRMSGVILYFGGSFSQVIFSILDHNLIRLMLVGLTFVFFYHSLNGIRHLAWDIGKGFEPNQVMNSGILIVCLTFILTALFWWFI